MRQRGYLVLFIFVLLLACAGGFLGGRFLIRRWQQDFRPRDAWAPPPPVAQGTVLPGSCSTSAPADLPRTIPDGGTPATAMHSVTPTATRCRSEDSAQPPPEPTPLEPEPTATETPSPARRRFRRFFSTWRGRCGTVPAIVRAAMSSAGSLMRRATRCPMSGCGWRMNTATSRPAATKSGGEAGRYDFPIFGPPRRFYLSVVDGGGQPLSPGSRSCTAWARSRRRHVTGRIGGADESAKRRISEARISESANQRISESANRRISESANQRISESANQRIGESANRRISESANRRISESANQRISESANQRTGESANRRIGESANRRIGESANRRISESANQRTSESANQRTRRIGESAITHHAIRNTQYAVRHTFRAPRRSAARCRPPLVPAGPGGVQIRRGARHRIGARIWRAAARCRC